MDGETQRGHRALRKARCSAAGQIYLVTTTTLLRERVFSRFDVACAAAREIAAPREDIDVLCWVLMPDHLHALVELREGSLSGAIGNLKARVATAANRARGDRRRVWSRAFHDRALRRDEDVLDFARYVVCNPVRAGLVRSIRQYAFWDAVWLES